MKPLLPDFLFVGRSGVETRSDVLGPLLDIDDLLVISAIVDLLGIGGMSVRRVPGEVDGPGARLPLSHLVPVPDGRGRRLRSAHPVHDLVVIGRVVDGALRPVLAPVGRLVLLDFAVVPKCCFASIIVTFQRLIEGVDVRLIDRVGKLDGLSAGDEEHNRGEFHFIIIVMQAY